MSNETRYVRILPSAVHSEYDWSPYEVGRIYPVQSEKEGLYNIADPVVGSWGVTFGGLPFVGELELQKFQTSTTYE